MAPRGSAPALLLDWLPRLRNVPGYGIFVASPQHDALHLHGMMSFLPQPVKTNISRCSLSLTTSSLTTPMSYYQYYRQQPGWGTSSYRIGAPPGPLFVPQPGWRGRHFYRAQAAGLQGELDQELFEHVWRDGKPHIGRRIVASEARKWHRRIYGGVEFPGRLLPHELGAAAGYEAFQQWAMYGQVYRPVLRGEKEREKEALAGMALGESAKLASLIVPGQNRKFHAEAGAIAIGVAWKLRKEAKEEGEEMEEAEEEAIGRRGGRPRLRKRRSSFTYGEVISSSDSDGERLEAANLAVPGRYPPMAGGAGLGLRSPVFGNTSYSPALSPQTATILPQSTGLVPQATGGAYQSGVSSNGQASIPSGHRRIQYVNSSGQPIQYVTASGQPIVYVTPMGTGTNTAAAQPQYAQATQQPQYVVVPQSNMGSFAPGAGVGGAGYGVQPQYGVAGQQAGMMPGQQFAGMMPGQQAAGLMPGQQVAGLMPGQQAAGMMPGQQGYNLPQQQYTGLGAGYPAYGAAGQGYGRPRAYSVVNPPGGYDQRVF